MHYQRWWANGTTDLLPGPVVKQCSIDDCTGTAQKRGWCQKHYRRWQRHGTIDDPPAKPTRCRTEDCPRPPRSLGWCKPCYKRFAGQGSAHEMKRYAAKLGSMVEDVSYAVVVETHGMLCHICERPIQSRDDLHIDHVIPLARGGPHTYENLRPAHKRCNQRKHAKLMSELIAA